MVASTVLVGVPTPIRLGIHLVLRAYDLSVRSWIWYVSWHLNCTVSHVGPLDPWAPCPFGEGPQAGHKLGCLACLILYGGGQARRHVFGLAADVRVLPRPTMRAASDVGNSSAPGFLLLDLVRLQGHVSIFH